jgi:cell division septal protein FtsQ
VKNVPLIFGASLIIILFWNKRKSIEFIKKFYGDNLEQFLTRHTDICNNIEIKGNYNLDYKKLRDNIDNFCNNKNYDLEILKNNIIEDPWVKDIYLKKILPDKLKIEIAEYYPFAIFFDGKKHNLVDQFGNIINIGDKELHNFKHLLIAGGNGFEEEINSFFNLLSVHDDITKSLRKIERIGRRRWDLTLKNGLLIKLPEEDENIFEVWNALEKMLNTYGLVVDLESIDLRVRDKVYLQYNKSQFPTILNVGLYNSP